MASNSTYVRGFVVEIAVVEHQPKVINALLRTAIDVLLQLLLYRGHIHRVLDHLEVVLCSGREDKKRSLRDKEPLSRTTTYLAPSTDCYLEGNRIQQRSPWLLGYPGAGYQTEYQ